MNPKSFILLVIVALSFSLSPASAETFRMGDIFVNRFGDRLIHYRADGTLVQFFMPSGPSSEGATITRDGKVVTTFRSTEFSPTGLSVFDSHGHETVIPTPEVSIPADVSVFSNGTLAVSDQGDNKVEFYLPNGEHLLTIRHATFGTSTSPFGSAVGPDDTLWVALFSSGVSRFAKDGTFLGNFRPFEVQDLAVDPVDGTLWIPSPDGKLHHFSPEGVELGSFSTAVVPPFVRGVAVAADQSIYVTSFVRNTESTPMLHYDPYGQLLDQFEIPSLSLFISVNTVPEPGALPLVCTCIAAATLHCRVKKRAK